MKICGEYTYHAPENVTPEQAKQTALDRAKLAALAEKFGTVVSQNNATVVKNENEQSDISFLSLGGSEVKGEWLEDSKEPKYSITYEQEMLVVNVSVCGKAREITGVGIDFSAKILRNGTEAKHESDNFKNGDDLFLLFKSPATGYLAVYLIDESQTAFCLLPYMNDHSGKVKIEGGKEYIFFSEKHAEPSDITIVNEYTMTCKKSVEQNFICVIFSPNEFIKANDSKAPSLVEKAGKEVVLPRELSYEEFQTWLTKNKSRDKDLKVEYKVVTIKR
ncbi:MAG: DUF4384 domain-containing protein [Tannerella sp.]|nr:DUF4384 domain-containing protein [Tannerella sp.]